MRCSHCGTENRDIARFCQRCGTPLPAGVGAAQKAAQKAVHEAAHAGVTPDEIPSASEAMALDAPGAETLGASAETPGSTAQAEAATSTAPLLEAPEGAAAVATDPPAVAGADASPGAGVDTAELAPAGPDQPADEDADAAAERAEGADAADAAVPEKGEPIVVVEASDSALQAGSGGGEDAGDTEPWVDEPLTEGEDDETWVPLEDVAVPVDGAPAGDASPAAPDGGEGPAPLPAGTVLGGRYRVVDLLVTGPDETVYRARDLKRCPQCAFDGNSPDQAFCDACGAVLDTKPFVTLLERGSVGGPQIEGEVLDHFIEEGRAFWVWLEARTQTDVLVEAEAPMQMVIGQLSDAGQVRELDEDSLLVMTLSRTLESIEHTTALFVVADGMGGHQGGEVASRIALQALGERLLHSIFAAEFSGAPLADEPVRNAMAQAVQEANEQVFLERERRQNDMGTTMTVALLRDWTLTLAHVGDCRAYRWGSDGLQQLTTDHSVVASMVATGVAKPEEIYTHPQRSVIYRCIGDQPSVEVDTAILTVEPGDRLVLCCDGLWEMLREGGIEEVLLREPDPQRACQTMVDQANRAGGPDNISVIVVQL